MTLIARYPATSLISAMVISGTIGAVVTEAGTDPITTVFWRATFGTAVLLPWCLLRGHLRPSCLSLRDLGWGLLAGLSLAASWVAYLLGFELTDIVTTTVVYNLQPFFVILLAARFLREKVTVDEIFWMLTAFVGVVFASGIGTQGASLDSCWLMGLGVALFGAVTYAIPTIIGKKLTHQAPEVTALCQTLVGMAMLAPFTGPMAEIPNSAWPWLFTLGAVHTGLIYLLMFGAVPHLPTPLVAVIGFLTLVVIILVDWAIYGHPLGWAKSAEIAAIMLATLGISLRWQVLRWLRQWLLGVKRKRVSRESRYGVDQSGQAGAVPHHNPSAEHRP